MSGNNKNNDAQRMAMQGALKAAEMAQDSKATKDELVGAAAAGAAAGMLIAGPAVAVVGAMGAGIAAASDKGDCGEVARATGRAASAAIEKMKEIDREHHVTEKVKEGVKKAIETGKKLDEEHHIVDRVKQGTIATINKAKELNEEHHITEKASKAVVQGLNALTHVIKEGCKNMEKGKEGAAAKEDGAREYDFAEEAAKAGAALQQQQQQQQKQK